MWSWSFVVQIPAKCSNVFNVQLQVLNLKTQNLSLLIYLSFLASEGRDPISIAMDVAETNPAPTLCNQEGGLVVKID